MSMYVYIHIWTIGLYQSLFRVWAKARSGLVKQWERDHASINGFSSGKNRSSIDVVWRQAFAAEAARFSQQHYGCIMWDIHKCYELVQHSHLVHAAYKHDYPLAILRLSLASYRAPRRILLNGLASRNISANCGIIAGNTFATTELRLLLLDTVSQHICDHPSIRLNIVVDDLSLDHTGPDSLSVAKPLIEAAQDLSHSLQDCTDLTIAKNKTAVLANTKQTARIIRKGLKELGGPPLTAARALGVDFWAAAPIRPRFGVRRARLASYRIRRPRIKKLSTANKSLSGKIFVAGIIPSLLFDQPIFGCFGNTLKQIRREAGVISGISGRKRDVDMAFSLNPTKDPEVISASAVIGRYCVEVWNAALDPAFRDPAGTSFGSLALGVSNYIAKHPLPPAHVSGPISAFHLALAKANWSFHTPFALKSADGSIKHLPSTAPKRIIASFKRDLQGAIVARYATRIHAKHDSHKSKQLLEQGIFLDPLLSMCKSLSFHDARTLLAINTNGIFTNFDLMQYGYDINPACPLCNASLDTVFHRCFTCVHSARQAEIALGTRLYDQILAAGDESMLATRCIMPSPPMTSAPSRSTLFECINMSAGDTFAPSDGEVFLDGSCLFSNTAPLARAGFAAVQINAEGDVLRGLYGCLPASMPQTSLAAEYAAFATFLDNIDRGAFVGDCQEVIDRVNGPLADAISAANPLACFWKSLVLRHGLDLGDKITDVVKIKAHIQEHDDMDSSTRFRTRGNGAADKFAKLGASLHAPAPSDVAAYKKAKGDLRALANHMIGTLSSFNLSRPEMQTRVPRLPRGVVFPGAVSSSDVDKAHKFMWQGKMWFCTICLKQTLLPTSCRSPCMGPPLFEALLRDSKGHQLSFAALKGGGVILFCTLCYRYASPHPRMLKRRCQGHPIAGSSEKHYLVRRMHPVTRQSLCRPVPLHGLN